MADDERQIKSKARVRARGEVFTAAREVNAMLDLVKDETENIDAMVRQIRKIHGSSPDALTKVELVEEEIDQDTERLREHHVERLKNRKCL